MNDMEKRMTTSSSMFYVLCENLGNPTCDYFRKTALLLSNSRFALVSRF